MKHNSKKHKSLKEFGEWFDEATKEAKETPLGKEIMKEINANPPVFKVRNLHMEENMEIIKKESLEIYDSELGGLENINNSQTKEYEIVYGKKFKDTYEKAIGEVIKNQNIFNAENFFEKE